MKRKYRRRKIFLLIATSLLVTTFFRDFWSVAFPRNCLNILDVPLISDFITKDMEIENGKYKFCNYPWEPTWLECCFDGGDAEVKTLLSSIPTSARTWKIEKEEIPIFHYVKFLNPIDTKGYVVVNEGNPRILVLFSAYDMNGKNIVALLLQ